VRCLSFLTFIVTRLSFEVLFGVTVFEISIALVETSVVDLGSPGAAKEEDKNEQRMKKQK